MILYDCNEYGYSADFHHHHYSHIIQIVVCLIGQYKCYTLYFVQGIDLQDLLLSLHDFFMYLGVDEIRKRSSSDDKPLRMVKTILHELCKMQVRQRSIPLISIV